MVGSVLLHHLRFGLVLAATIFAISIHALARWPIQLEAAPPTVTTRLSSVSYTSPTFPPSQLQSSLETTRARIQVEKELENIAALANNVRTYSVAGVMGEVPALAWKLGLTVSLGLHVDMRDRKATRAEIERGIALARRWPNVVHIYVGNETLLRKETSPQQLRQLMREVRRRTGKPVSTGETWNTWMRHPELAEDASFIAAHILPFWEGVPAGQAVTKALEHYQSLQNRFPGKLISIAEFGWPSARLNHHAAIPSSQNQALVLRQFVSVAERDGLHYNIIEAFDQPWKTQEGSVGQFWGFLDASGHAKFAWQGGLETSTSWRIALWLGVGLGLCGYLLLGRMERATPGQWLIAAPASQAVGYVIADVLVTPVDYYLSMGQWLAWLISIPLVIVLALTSGDRLRELTQMRLGRQPRRLFASGVDAACTRMIVSIHVPIRNERMEVVRATLQSLAQLDHRDYEVLAIVNNYDRPELRRDVERLCRQLGPRFVLVDLPRVAGFKAGALNKALARTDPRAEIIAVVDADYIVDRRWLRQTLPAFAAAKIALVQSPQDHRDAQEHRLGAAMNAEYGAFFDIGMIQRNEHDAIIAHGTMLLIRRSALNAVGGWDEHCICEDTELGLRLLINGWHSLYTNVRYGAGLLPDDFSSYRGQRQRWAYGAITILRKHWRAILSPRTSLTLGQRYHFLLGWGHWLGDGLGLMLALFNLLWAALMLAGGYGEPPPLATSYAFLSALAVAGLHGVLSHYWRPGGSLRLALASSGCALALQMPIGRGVARAIAGRRYPFIVTAKGQVRAIPIQRLLRELVPDMTLALALVTSATLLLAGNRFEIAATDLFAVTLLLQSLPYLAAITIGLSTARQTLRRRQPRICGPERSS